VARLVSIVVALICLRNLLTLWVPELWRPVSEAPYSATVLDARALLQESLPEGQDYWLEKALQEDVDFYQHLVFAAWPQRPSKQALHQLIRAGNTGFSKCTRLGVRGGVALVRCH
jgi:hypothetical protein